MSKLIFKSDEVRRVVEHALAAKKFDVNYDGVEQRHKVMLVHDQGVYLMSAGSPRDIVDKESRRSYVAYAEGCGPDPDGYDMSRALVGGDDFSEYLPAKDVERFMKLGNRVVIELTSDNMRLGCETVVEKPAKKKKVKK